MIRPSSSNRPGKRFVRPAANRNGQCGFTLIEVMVALTIASLGLAAVAAAVSQMVDAGAAVQQRTYASWIAQNRIAEMRLANVVPEVDVSRDEVNFAGLDWAWTSTVAETGVPNLFRVDVEVSLAGSDYVIRTVTGFIGEPGVPGQANIAWSRNSQAVGESQ